ncbi:MAG TPA: bifunctional riboflavin kinase/FAD synthetase [Rugosibacter sp.]
MLVFRGVPTLATTSTVLTIGNFDGVHRGHRALLSRLIAKARECALPATVLTFDPHPREFLNPEQAPARLSNFREKMTLLAECGIDRVHVCHFNAALAEITAEEFIETILVKGLAVRHLIIGDDFCFGKGRKGNFAMFQQAGVAHRFGIEAMHTVTQDHLRISSSAVRDALAAGNIEQARALLGRSYVMTGRVMHGEKIGRTLGFPTLNLHIKHTRLPLTGVFAVTVSGIDTRPLPGVANIGVRPTLGEGLKPVLEVHLLNFDNDVYGKHVSVDFLHKIRDEQRFASLDALKAQITRDTVAARIYFAAVSMTHNTHG